MRFRPFAIAALSCAALALFPRYCLQCPALLMRCFLCRSRVFPRYTRVFPRYTRPCQVPHRGVYSNTTRSFPAIAAIRKGPP